MTKDKLFLIIMPLFFLGGIVGSIFLCIDDSQMLFTKIFVPTLVLFINIMYWANLWQLYEAWIYPNEYQVKIWNGSFWEKRTIRGNDYPHAIKRLRKRRKFKPYEYIEQIHTR